MSDLPDVSANFRSMMYMGITSTNQTSIQSPTGARDVDRSATLYLFASPRIKPIPSPFLSSSSSSSFWLWLAILGAHIHANTRTREASPAPPPRTTLLPHLPTEDRCIQMSHRAPARMCHWSGVWQRREVEEKPPEVASSVGAAFKSDHVSGTCCRWRLKRVRSAVPGAQLGKPNVPSAGRPHAAYWAKGEMVISARSASKNKYRVRIK